MRIDKNKIFNDAEKHWGSVKNTLMKHSSEISFNEIKPYYDVLYWLNNYKNPKRIWLTETFIDKAINFCNDQKAFNGLMKNCRKIGFQKGESFALGNKDGAALVQVEKSGIVYKQFYNNELYLIGFSEFTGKETVMPYKFEILYFREDIAKKIYAGVSNDMLLYTACYGISALFTFIYFVDIKEVELKPREKFKPNKGIPVKNITANNIIVADVNWDYDIVSNSPFAVSGHWRFQPCGIGLTKIKLIYIKPFMKKGYHREAGKNKI
jgi:hypothetical protein